jgi:cytidylate kinase
MTLGAFTQLCESDHSIDRKLDAAMAERAKEGQVVLEGRLAGYIARANDLQALKVWLTASEEVRAQRVGQREGESWREVLRVNHDRHESDSKRYFDIYGWDLRDTGIYDLVLNTDGETPEALAAQLAVAARNRFAPAGSAA